MSYKTFIKYNLYIRGFLDKKDDFKLIQKGEEFNGIKHHKNKDDAQKELDTTINILKTPYTCSKVEIISAKIREVA